MAHIGRNYPVAFRRDLNVNCRRNVLYLPRVWSCQYRGFDGSVAAALGTRIDFYAYEQDGPTAELARWETAVERVAGRDVQNIITITVGDREDFRLTFSLNDRIAGNLWTGVLEYSDRREYDEFAISGLGDVFPRPELIRDNGLFSNGTIRRVPWAIYNTLP